MRLPNAYDGFTIGFDYDANNHVIRAADQANNAATRTLDVDGRPRSITDPMELRILRL